MKKKVVLGVLIFLFVLVTILKHALTFDLPIAANVTLGIDDALMIKNADSISNGQWLGKYDDNTLSKGATFPLLLAVSNFLNIDYVSMVTIIYTIACILFVLVISKKIKNKAVLLLIYTVALFVPIMYSYQVLQRVYRNSLIPSFAIMIISGYLYLFFERNEENFLKKSIVSCLTGIVLALFWYTREDSIWMIPFIVFMTIATLIGVLIKTKKINKVFVRTIALLIIPIIIVSIYKNFLCFQNEKYYGVYSVYNNESYKEAMEALKKVKKYDYHDRIDYTRKKITKVCFETCMGHIHGKIDGYMLGYSTLDTSPVEGEVENGWFPWALRGAMKENGFYDSAQNTNMFFERLTEDINKALEEGRLEKEDVGINPIVKVKMFFEKLYLTLDMLYKYDDVMFEEKTTDSYRPEYDDAYKKFTELTNNKFIVYDSENVNKSTLYFEDAIEYEKDVKAKASIINSLNVIYKHINVIVFSLGIITYIIMTIIMIIEVIKKKFQNVENWVAISGILGALFTLVCGIAYETAFNANVITAMYLSAAYPLMLIFGLISCIAFIKIVLDFVKTKNNNIIKENK